MARVLNYFAHPAVSHSIVNVQLKAVAEATNDVTFVDLYAKYPRFQIDVEHEQQLLLEHDIIVFQFPIYWYSSPSIIKEWLDLVLVNGFAFGVDGDKLSGKRFLLSLTTGGSENDYSSSGYQNFELRQFLRPFEQTANLCNMNFTAPYVLYQALHADTNGALETHVSGYKKLLETMGDDTFDFDAIASLDTFDASHIRTVEGASK